MKGEVIKYWEIVLKDGTVLKDKTYRFIEHSSTYIHVYDLIPSKQAYTKGHLWWKHKVEESFNHKEKLMILNRDDVSRMNRHWGIKHPKKQKEM